MPWPIDEQYVFSRQDLETLLTETCWAAVEKSLKDDPDHALPLCPPAIDAAVEEAIEGLWRQVVCGEE